MVQCFPHFVGLKKWNWGAFFSQIQVEALVDFDGRPIRLRWIQTRVPLANPLPLRARHCERAFCFIIHVLNGFSSLPLFE